MERGMIVERIFPSGDWLIYETGRDGHLFVRRYNGFTRSEAVRLFRDDLIEHNRGFQKPSRSPRMIKPNPSMITTTDAKGRPVMTGYSPQGRGLKVVFPAGTPRAVAMRRFKQELATLDKSSKELELPL
jgi:hypothetical protein